MAALLRVEWTARSERDLAGIHEFILLRWTVREADAFLGQVIDFERRIAKWPKGFRRSERNKQHRLGLVHRNTMAVYRVFRDRIVIITLFDTRSNSPH
ncbi:MAG: type II toxin-antitoxin system RelE/ParE family toxin [Flavobacteriales bacterium]|nr:type II toxin-antitoxin system RelE/ParE family toxin [Flavobacteriales bacterium]MBP9159922.1 type II toxin-antitoxin system RelE/ParE family toxin [Flavobacteriales bacterium]